MTDKTMIYLKSTLPSPPQLSTVDRVHVILF